MALSRSAALAVPMLKPDEEERLIRAWKLGGDVSARDRIVHAYARLCYRIAAGYSSNPDHIEDLAQEGVFGILRALDKFDPGKGVKFSTYSRFWVHNFIAARASQVVSVISVPSRAFIDARMGRIPPGRNDHAVAAVQPFVALDSPAGEEGGESLMDRMACPRPNPEEAASAATAQKAYSAAIKAAMETLAPRERAVIEARRLSDPPRTLEEISVEFGVTRERVRQIEVAALQKLRSALEAGGFDPAVHFTD